MRFPILQKFMYEILKSFDFIEITLISSDFTEFIDFKYLYNYLDNNISFFRTVCVECTNVYQGHMEGGLLGFQETPFDSKIISKITCLNKYMIVNIATSQLAMPTSLQIRYSTFQKLLCKQFSYCQCHQHSQQQYNSIVL